MSKFQLILTGAFGVFIIVGILAFAFFRGSGGDQVQVTVWGTVPQQIWNNTFSQTELSKDKLVKISYVEKTPSSFQQSFIEALADGRGPDVVFLSHEELFKNSSRLFPIPYQTYSERDFKNTFVEEAELFLQSDGILAFPMLIDPLVMYWNRDIFTNNSLSSPPAFWDEFYTLSQNLTQKDGAFNILKSTVALGEYSNVDNAKDIVSTLIFQAGGLIIKKDVNRSFSTLLDNFGLPVAPATAALTFYTEFSNPAKPFYSWNRSLPSSQNMFTSGDLAIYFGFSSELDTLRLKNPNLNFDVSVLPQSRTGQRKITFGRMHGLAIVKSARNISGAYSAIVNLTSSPVVQVYVSNLKMPPARRDLLTSRPSDGFSQVFFDSALWAKGWRDPYSLVTNKIFKDLIENITGGRTRFEQALARAHQELQNLLQK